MATYGSVGERLRLVRIFFNISQSSLSLLSGTKIGTLNKAEQNRYTPAASVLFKVAQTLHVEGDWLLEGHPPMFAAGTIVFLWLNLEASRKQGSRQQKILGNSSSTKEIIKYLMGVQGVRRGSLFAHNGKRFLILQCERRNSPSDYVVLDSDIFVSKAVVEALRENEVDLVTHDLSETEQSDAIVGSIEKFYKEAPSYSFQEGLAKMLRRYNKKGGPNDRVLFNFAEYIEEVDPTKVISPVQGASDKVIMLLQFIQDLGISQEDASRALKMITTGKPWKVSSGSKNRVP